MNNCSKRTLCSWFMFSVKCIGDKLFCSEAFWDEDRDLFDFLPIEYLERLRGGVKFLIIFYFDPIYFPSLEYLSPVSVSSDLLTSSIKFANLRCLLEPRENLLLWVFWTLDFDFLLKKSLSILYFSGVQQIHSFSASLTNSCMSGSKALASS